MEQKFLIYNTLTRSKERFEPLHAPNVGMYVCGPTVYGDPHLGHARPAITFDILFRYLKHLGYKVRYVRNITDVGHLEHDADEGEDKIAKKARLEQLEPMEIAQYYTNRYHDAMAALNVLRARLAPEKIPSGSAVAAACGVTLGFTTQVANAAGPVAAIYFLAMKLPKEKYMGCSAWFFLIINWTKLPIFLWEGRITMEALKIDLMMIPFLLIGAALGILLLSRMPQKLFENIIQVLVVLTAIKLFF